MSEFVETALAGKSIVVAAWLAMLLAAERLCPAVRRLGGWARIGRNAGLWLVNVVLSPLVVLPVAAWAAGHAQAWRPDWLGGWSGLALDLLVLDGLLYWWHRANHEIPLLWRFHAIHHLDGFLDVSTALRFHFGEVLLSAAARAVVVVLLAVPFTSVVVFEVLLLAAAAFHHSNLRLPSAVERALARAVVTPSIHWVHHHAVRADTDSNYATVLSLWDPLFGSRSRTRRTPDMPIGTEGENDAGLPGLLLRPFRRR
jgi:sterol desaturase/sphingolipid hydroxylase (fatty acid hydroxylase superfamily)